MHSYLALGDSYTIGEQVHITDSFPYQTVQLLRRAGLNFYAPEIIAVTGFTTDELLRLMDKQKFLSGYDFISVLIGVNNQYRGRNINDFNKDLETIIGKAIAFASNNSNHVFVLSIPDWGVTPFAKDRNPEQVKLQINAFNGVCASVAAKMNVQYIDITEAQRRDGHLEEFVAADKLHPSGKEYAKWAEKLSAGIKKMIGG
jgi:lysophospholipase L1-like esterase